jgi:hypothetical protein
MRSFGMRRQQIVWSLRRVFRFGEQAREGLFPPPLPWFQKRLASFLTVPTDQREISHFHALGGFPRLFTTNE